MPFYDLSQFLIKERKKKLIELEQREFGGCCVAFEIYAFPEERNWSLYGKETNYDNYSGERNYATKADFLDALRRELYINTQTNKLNIVILAEYQLWFRSAVTKAGYRLVSDRVRNNGSGNRLYMFVHDGKKIFKEKKPKRIKKRVFSTGRRRSTNFGKGD